jgi:ribosomal protein S18 acetylase RimI-like enzyme
MIQIRPGQLGDAEAAAVLLYSAYIHEQVTYPLPEEQRQGWIKNLQRHFLQKGNRFSYENVYVAEQGAGPVGLVLSFGGRDEAWLNAAVGPWLEREARDDEWYVDALAVFTNWGRQGIGSNLMQTAEQQARQRLYTKIALHVALENQRALDLYTHLGYVATEQDILYDRPHVRMVKTLDDEESASITT